MVFGSEWQKECDRIPKVLNRVSLIVLRSFLYVHFKTISDIDDH